MTENEQLARGIAAADRGEFVDGEQFMAEMMAEIDASNARHSAMRGENKQQGLHRSSSMRFTE